MINLVKIYPHVFFTLMCLLTVASTLTTTYSSINTLKQLSWGVMSLFSVIIISLIIRYFSKIAKIKRSYNSEAFNIEPSLCNMILDLAKQMKVKLDTKCPLVFKKGLNNASYNKQTNQLILGDILFNKLNIQEILAIIGHEFGHIKYIYKLVLSLFVIPLILAISTIIISPECNCITLFILFVSTFLTLFPFANRTSEYKADLESAKEIGAENLISALTKITSPEEHNREYITHPSINKRIRNLISYKTKSNSTSH